MGSGPAIFLAAHYDVGALILMSPYTSIKNVVKNKVGWLSFLIAEHFDNIKLMPKVKSATFIVHGQKDNLISFEHSQELHEKCSGESVLVLPTEMSHNDFDLYSDLIKPLLQFLMQIKMNLGPNEYTLKV